MTAVARQAHEREKASLRAQLSPLQERLAEATRQMETMTAEFEQYRRQDRAAHTGPSALHSPDLTSSDLTGSHLTWPEYRRQSADLTGPDLTQSTWPSHVARPDCPVRDGN